VGVLSHFLEEEGVPTTQISLIREHTEVIKPPRALWVSFELGRPLGLPNDETFQTRVVLAALKLLESPRGPVLEEFPEDAPDGGDGVAGWACPVSFSHEESDLDGTGQLGAALKQEIMHLGSWYDLAVKKRGRTTVGLSGLGPDALGDFILGFLGEGIPESPSKDLSLGLALKFAAEDLKAYYLEAVSAQPGPAAPSSEQLADWFWGETTAGKVLFAVKEACANSEDSFLQTVGGRLIIPMAQAHRSA
jgi:hypothetical protein